MMVRIAVSLVFMLNIVGSFSINLNSINKEPASKPNSLPAKFPKDPVCADNYGINNATKSYEGKCLYAFLLQDLSPKSEFSCGVLGSDGEHCKCVTITESKQNGMTVYYSLLAVTSESKGEYVFCNSSVTTLSAGGQYEARFLSSCPRQSKAAIYAIKLFSSNDVVIFVLCPSTPGLNPRPSFSTAFIYTTEPFPSEEVKSVIYEVLQKFHIPTEGLVQISHTGCKPIPSSVCTNAFPSL